MSNTVREYIKKPLVISAIQWDGSNQKAVADFMRVDTLVADPLVIPTLEGDMTASIGDYIIKGIQDEFYPCKESIFLDSYDPFNPRFYNE